MSGREATTSAYATLLTRPTYLAGATLLAHSLHKHSPSTPLIILYTPETLPEPVVKAVRAEARLSNIIIHPVEHLRLPDDGEDHGMVAERFIDTWTKLRVFELDQLSQERGFKRMCFLDADMMVFSDPSPLIFSRKIDDYLDGGDGLRIMATHVCVCNLDNDSWAPTSWHKENCAFTHLTSSEQLPEVKSEPDTLGIFNSGTFVFHPSTQISDFVCQQFETMGPVKLRKMKFPDQDFLNEAFASRWSSLSWKTNALKTWRYWHPNIWRDDEVAVLHYIVDKPWAARVQDLKGKEDAEGELKAGYLGKDGVTHQWWWDEYERWQKERQEQGENELLGMVAQHAASKHGNDSEEMRAIGGGAQDFAKKFRDKTGDDGDDEYGSGFGLGPQGPILRQALLGERGHGPVARGRGRGRGLRGEGWCVMDP